MNQKHKARDVMASAGVPVAQAQVLRRGFEENPTIELPFIIKPCTEANSIGITLVEK